VRTSLASKLARHLHTSRSIALLDILPAFKHLFTSDREFEFATTLTLNLDEKEAAFLLDEKEDSHAVRHLMERVAKVRGRGEPAAGGILDAGDEAPTDD